MSLDSVKLAATSYHTTVQNVVHLCLWSPNHGQLVSRWLLHGPFFGGGLQSEFLDSRETGDRAVLSDSWNLSFHLTESLNS